MDKIKNILLIDDSISSNQYNRVLLEEVGVAENIVIKNTAESALDFLRGEETADTFPKPELILLDIAMPQMDGFMFLEAYAKLPKKATNDFGTILAIVSDHVNPEIMERSKAYQGVGVMEQIKKPMDKEDITNLIEEYFEC